MPVKFAVLLGASALVLGAALPAAAQDAAVTTKTTTEVVPLADGGVVYESHKVTQAVPTGERPIVFYYYDAQAGEIVAASDLTQDIFNIWDQDRNGYISPQEYYRNVMVSYEPVETETRIFVVDEKTGRLKLTQEEYTMRLEQVPYYRNVNTDKKPGLSVYEFIGTGFQEADRNDDNQVSFSELKDQFYKQPRLASDQEIYNQ